MESLPNVVFLPGAVLLLLRLLSTDWNSLPFSLISGAEVLLYLFTLYLLYQKVVRSEEDKVNSEEKAPCPALNLIEAFGDLMEVELQFEPPAEDCPYQPLEPDIPRLLSELQTSFQSLTSAPCAHATVWEVCD